MAEEIVPEEPLSDSPGPVRLGDFTTKLLDEIDPGSGSRLKDDVVGTQSEIETYWKCRKSGTSEDFGKE